jgi:hypothetical protein
MYHRQNPIESTDFLVYIFRLRADLIDAHSSFYCKKQYMFRPNWPSSGVNVHQTWRDLEGNSYCGGYFLAT